MHLNIFPKPVIVLCNIELQKLNTNDQEILLVLSACSLEAMMTFELYLDLNQPKLSAFWFSTMAWTTCELQINKAEFRQCFISKSDRGRTKRVLKTKIKIAEIIWLNIVFQDNFASWVRGLRSYERKHCDHGHVLMLSHRATQILFALLQPQEEHSSHAC